MSDSYDAICANCSKSDSKVEPALHYMGSIGTRHHWQEQTPHTRLRSGSVPVVPYWNHHSTASEQSKQIATKPGNRALTHLLPESLSRKLGFVVSMLKHVQNMSVKQVVKVLNWSSTRYWLLYTLMLYVVQKRSFGGTLLSSHHAIWPSNKSSSMKVDKVNESLSWLVKLRFFWSGCWCWLSNL